MTKPKWKRPTVKDIKKLQQQLASEQTSHRRTDELRRSARSDAFRDFARDSDLINEASKRIAEKLGYQIAVEVMKPVTDMFKERGLSEGMCGTICDTIAHMIGGELGKRAWYALEEWRADKSIPIVSLDMEQQYAEPVQVLRGEIQRITYCYRMKV